MDIKNKVVVITGGGRGLGKELAKTLAREGSRVIICSRNRTELSKVCLEVSNKNGSCEYFVVDVSDKKQVNKFIDDVVTRYRKIDVLINNAGYVHEWETIENTPEKEMERCFETNVYPIFYFLKKVIPLMKKQNEGTVINISSMAGKRGVPNLAAYSASKFAVIGLTQAVAKEVNNTGIYCITVCPGGMNTSMREKVLGSEDAKGQQDPKVVGDVIKSILIGKIKVPHGGDISIRYGEISAIDKPK